MDLARDGAALVFDAGLQVLGQLGQPLAGGGQFAVGLQPCAPALAGLDGPLQRRCQACQVLLEQVVAGTTAHGLHGRLFADLARHQDEGHHQARAAERRQGVQAGEPGQVVVRQDGVPGLGQGGLESRQVFHPREIGLQSGATQLQDGQGMVVLGVLQVQDAQARLQARRTLKLHA